MELGDCGHDRQTQSGAAGTASFITHEAGTRPLVAVWHEPRFSSGDEHGSEPEMQPLWEAAAAAGAPIVLNGHDHERFAALDAEGNSVSSGTTEYITGSADTTSATSRHTRRPASPAFRQCCS
jgi:hypothetical protein